MGMLNEQHLPVKAVISIYSYQSLMACSNLGVNHGSSVKMFVKAEFWSQGVGSQMQRCCGVALFKFSDASVSLGVGILIPFILPASA
uniref:N-acetyltransferase domain-containing protein n=1 Tax=Ascaris lumbricoides TaxID=6252 RepID=A0A0M3I8R1_ASCLU